MLGLVIASHGALAEGLLDAVTLITGPDTRERVRAVGLTPQESPESYGRRLGEAAAEVDGGGGVLFLTDLRGGTPFNQAVRQALGRSDRAVVFGASLPMLIDLLMNPDIQNLGAQSAAAAVCESARANTGAFPEHADGQTSA